MATKYQRTHRPVRVEQVKCTGRDRDGRGFCTSCGRHLVRGGRDHLPNRSGEFGWIEYYADGSTRKVLP